MELYCREIFSQGDVLELSTLATDMLQKHLSDSQSAVGWMAAGMYCQLKGDLDKAMSFLDKVHLTLYVVIVVETSFQIFCDIDIVVYGLS